MRTRRFRIVSTPQLRGWLAALERCPTDVTFVVDLRIAVRSELWMRERDEDQLDGWMLGVLKEWQ